MVKYTVTEDLRVVPVQGSGKSTKSYGQSGMSKDGMHEMAEEIYNASGKTQGGFIFDIIKGIGTMIKNGIEHKPAFQGVLGSGKGAYRGGMNDVVEGLYRSSGKTRGGFILDLIKSVGQMIDNGIKKKPAFENVLYHGKGKTKAGAKKTKAGAKKPKRQQTPAQKERAKRVKLVMSKKGLTMPQASKWLKDNGY